MPAAQTIDGVILALTQIVEVCGAENSRLGYFPALYRRVTERLKLGIAAGWFEDGPRMERLDVVFANRYLDAWDQWRAGRPVSASWQVAFGLGTRWRPAIVQHLMSGMNAHINLDLAIAAAVTCPGAQIQSLERDFGRINQVLAELIDMVQEEIAEVSPWMRLIKTFGGRDADQVLNLGIQAARGLSWQHALRLAALQGDGQEKERVQAMLELDCAVDIMGQLIVRPGPMLRTGLLLARVREERNTAKVMAVLSRSEVSN